MSCTSQLGHGQVAEAPDEQPVIAAVSPARRVTDAFARVREHLTGDDTFGQLARYAVVGGLSTLLYSLIFLGMAGAGDQVANLVGAIASTLLANELHRRLTFHAGEQVTWFTAQWEGGGLAAIGLVATSLALAGFHALFGDVSALSQIALVTAVTGVIGLIRFVALRAWVFSTGASAHR